MYERLVRPLTAAAENEDARRTGGSSGVLEAGWTGLESEQERGASAVQHGSAQRPATLEVLPGDVGVVEREAAAVRVTNEISSQLAGALARWMSEADRKALRLHLLAALFKLE
jgi:uncharacterized protein (DUF3084 family)